MGQIEFSDLALPFAEEEIEWRVQQAGESSNGRIWVLVVPYVTNRAIQQRLDDVCGPENWRNEFLPGPGGGVMCGIGIRVPVLTTNRTTGEVIETQEWLVKFDGAENTKGMDGDAAIKGGYSAAMKRAAVQFGVGRYLYALEETFGEVHERGRFRAKTKGGTTFRWNPPALPEWALPTQRSTNKTENAR
jgi:hypothetical protein